MLIISGKGSVAAEYLLVEVNNKIKKMGVLFDQNYPEYTLVLATQIPSISLSLRLGKKEELLNHFRDILEQYKTKKEYMILCMTAQRLLVDLKSSSQVGLNLENIIFDRVRKLNGSKPIYFIGTYESYDSFLDLSKYNGCKIENLIPIDGARVSDLILSIKRGYDLLGLSYQGHPKNVLNRILKNINLNGVFVLACTDLHMCKNFMVEMGIEEFNIIDVIDIAADLVIEKSKRVIPDFDEISYQKVLNRYKNIPVSDSLEKDLKTESSVACLKSAIKQICCGDEEISIIDLGSGDGSSIKKIIMEIRKHSNSRINLTCVDISEQALDSLRKNLHCFIEESVFLTILVGELSSLSIQNKYDVVVCLGVLLYITNDKNFNDVIGKIHGMLNTNGVLLVRDTLNQDFKSKNSYLDWGGVIRNELAYKEAFRSHGFLLIDKNELKLTERGNASLSFLFARV